MSYFDSQKEDPWASSFGSSAPAYSFGEQPTAPLQAPQPAFPTQQPEFQAPQPSFAAPQPSFTAPQATFAAPQTIQAVPFQGAPVPELPVYSPQTTAFQAPESETDGNKSSNRICRCCCFVTVWIFMMSLSIVSTMVGPIGPPGGPPPPSHYNMATSFVDRGSIDGLTRGICDGDYKYNVSSSGILQSGNYPAPYEPNTSCTNQFDSQADGITFEFQSFSTESHFDFIVIRDSNGNDFGGQPCSGPLTGLRVSVDSSRLPVSIYFKSDDIIQESGFSIAVSAGYQSTNELSNGPCGSQYNDYDYYYK